MKVRKETKIGIIAVVSIIIIYVGMNFLKGVYVFEKPTTYYGIYHKINGLEKSNPVMLNGFKIGQVRDISIVNDGTGRLLVTLTVNEDLDIPKDSKALLKAGDLLGSMQAHIILGESTEMAVSGDTLTPDVEGDLVEEVNAQLKPIKVKAESLISSIDSVISVIESILNPASQQNLVESFTGINRAIMNLERTTFRLDTLVREERQRIKVIFTNIAQVTDVLADNSESLNNIIQNFEQISDTLAKVNIAQTISSANDALTEVDGIVTKINEGEGSLGMLINNPELYERLESAANNLDLLVEDVRVNPNRYVQVSVFGRKNKSVELTRSELEQLKEYIKNSADE
jgi:phospholipid/cholesterol/gamma-HCH transport system substrate-binding protein